MSVRKVPARRDQRRQRKVVYTPPEGESRIGTSSQLERFLHEENARPARPDGGSAYQSRRFIRSPTATVAPDGR